MAAAPFAAVPVLSQAGPAAVLIDDILATHHETARALLDRMEAGLATLAARNAVDPRAAELIGALATEMRLHMQREEQVLFPLICELEALPEVSEADTGALLSPVVCMKREHRFIDELLEELGKLTGGYRAPEGADPAWAGIVADLAAFATDTREHVRREDEHLFPLAMELAPPVR